MNWNSWFDWGPAEAAIETLKKDVRLEAAKHLATMARTYAPVDTGDLFRSIHIVVDTATDTTSVLASMPYAQWVEFGHIAGNSTWVAPNPFMRNALADTARAFPEIAGSHWLGRPGGDSGSTDLGITFTATT